MLNLYVIGVWASSVLLLYSMLRCGHVMCASVLLLYSGWEHASVWACYVCFSVAVILWVGACFGVGMLCVLQCCCYSVVGRSMLPCGHVMCASVLLLFSGWEHASVWACYVCFSVAVIQWVGACDVCFGVGMLCVLQCCCSVADLRFDRGVSRVKCACRTIDHAHFPINLPEIPGSTTHFLIKAEELYWSVSAE